MQQLPIGEKLIAARSSRHASVPAFSKPYTRLRFNAWDIARCWPGGEFCEPPVSTQRGPGEPLSSGTLQGKAASLLRERGPSWGALPGRQAGQFGRCRTREGEAEGEAQVGGMCCNQRWTSAKGFGFVRGLVACCTYNTPIHQSRENIKCTKLAYEKLACQADFSGL